MSWDSVNVVAYTVATTAMFYAFATSDAWVARIIFLMASLFCGYRAAKELDGLVRGRAE